MAIKTVIRMGHPTLRKIAAPVTKEELQTPKFKQLIEDMYDTMEKEEGIGIAAPQINVSKQVAIVGRINEEDEIETLVIINPKITPLTEEMSGNWEGCLSVPGLRGYVERPAKVQVQYMDLEGNDHDVTLDDFTAIVFQHECDHLDGKLYVDHVKDPTKFSYLEEFMEYIEDEDYK
jgi:peptide deformylase